MIKSIQIFQGIENSIINYIRFRCIKNNLKIIVINIFLEPVRELFRLEELWGRRPAGKAATAAPAAGFDGENPA